MKKQVRVLLSLTYKIIACRCYCVCTCTYKCYYSWADLQCLLHRKNGHMSMMCTKLSSQGWKSSCLVLDARSLVSQHHWFYAEIPQADWVLSRQQPYQLHHVPRVLPNRRLLASLWRTQEGAPGGGCGLCQLHSLIPVQSRMRSCSFQACPLLHVVTGRCSAVDGRDAQLAPLNLLFKKTTLPRDCPLSSLPSFSRLLYPCPFHLRVSFCLPACKWV